MEKLAKWSTEREAVATEVNFVLARADEKGIDPKGYAALCGLATSITDAMFAFKCMSVHEEREDAEMFAEDFAKVHESYATSKLLALNVPNKRLKRRLTRTFTSNAFTDTLRLYELVGEIEAAAVIEKRAILEA